VSHRHPSIPSSLLVGCADFVKLFSSSVDKKGQRPNSAIAADTDYFGV